MFFLSPPILFHFQGRAGTQEWLDQGGDHAFLSWSQLSSMLFTPGLFLRYPSQQVHMAPFLSHAGSKGQVCCAESETPETDLSEISPDIQFPGFHLKYNPSPKKATGQYLKWSSLFKIKKEHIHTCKYRNGLRRKIFLFNQPLNTCKCQALFQMQGI